MKFMPPSFRKTIIILFLGFPGLLLGILGFFGIVLESTFLVAEDDLHKLNSIKTIALSGLISAIGLLMFGVARRLTDPVFRRSVGRHLPSLIVYQLTSLSFGAFFSAFSLCTLILPIAGRFDRTCPFLALVSFSGLIAVLIFQSSAEARWRADALPEELPSHGDLKAPVAP